MTTFTQFADGLASGPLKNSSAIDTVTGSLKPTIVEEILGYTNEGLLDLTTRQTLIMKTIDLVFQENQSMYPLDASAVGTYLLEDDTEPFGDFLRVVNVFDSEGCHHSTDTNGHIVTPVYDTLRFTDAKMEEFGEKVRIRYQARHPVITQDDSIRIPPGLISSLEKFVASRYYVYMGGKDHRARGDALYGQYLTSIGETITNDLGATSEIDEDTRFYDKGFV